MLTFLSYLRRLYYTMKVNTVQCSCVNSSTWDCRDLLTERLYALSNSRCRKHSSKLYTLVGSSALESSGCRILKKTLADLDDIPRMEALYYRSGWTGSNHNKSIKVEFLGENFIKILNINAIE